MLSFEVSALAEFFYIFLYLSGDLGLLRLMKAAQLLPTTIVCNLITPYVQHESPKSAYNSLTTIACNTKNAVGS